MFRPCRTGTGKKKGRAVKVSDDLEEGHIIKVNEKPIHLSTHIANVSSTVHVTGDKEMKESTQFAGGDRL